jgi:hypothetical protein
MREIIPNTIAKTTAKTTAKTIPTLSRVLKYKKEQTYALVGQGLPSTMFINIPKVQESESGSSQE